MCVRTMLQWIRAFLRATWMPCCQNYPRLRSPENTPQVMLLLCASLPPAADDKPSSFLPYHPWLICTLRTTEGDIISRIQLHQYTEPVGSPQLKSLVGTDFGRPSQSELKLQALVIL